MLFICAESDSGKILLSVSNHVMFPNMKGFISNDEKFHEFNGNKCIILNPFVFDETKVVKYQPLAHESVDIYENKLVGMVIDCYFWKYFNGFCNIGINNITQSSVSITITTKCIFF